MTRLVTLIKMYFNARELKQILNILLVAYKIRHEDYFPRLAGIKFEYHPYRMLFDQVANVYLGDDVQGYELVDFDDETKLYSVATTSYVGEFLWLVEEISYGTLKVVPKDAKGLPLADLNRATVMAPTGVSLKSVVVYMKASQFRRSCSF